MGVVRVLGMVAVVASAARGFVAFAEWRRALVHRLIGAEPHSPGTALRHSISRAVRERGRQVSRISKAG
jgi:hypothetical protein